LKERSNTSTIASNASLVPISRNTPQVIEKGYDNTIDYNRMMVEREEMFFLDETGIQIFSRATYGRSTEGIRAIKRVKTIRSRNYSIATAMNNESLFFFEIQEKPYN
jgi:hypothetical protein